MSHTQPEIIRWPQTFLKPPHHVSPPLETKSTFQVIFKYVGVALIVWCNSANVCHLSRRRTHVGKNHFGYAS